MERHRSSRRRWVPLVSLVLLSPWGSLAAGEDGCFGPPAPLGTLDYQGGVNVGGGSLTTDGLTVYYDIWRDGASPPLWIMKATRDSVGEPFAGGTRLGTEVNRWSRNWGPRISPDGATLYYSGLGVGAGGWDLVYARHTDPGDPDAPFEPSRPVPGLNTTGADLPGCVSPSGEEIFFVRQGNLWTARFVEPHEPAAGFSDIRELGRLNTSQPVFGPAMSPDGRYLVWSDTPNWWAGDSYRPGGHGGPDLWMAVCASPEPDAVFGPPINLPAPPNSGGEEYQPWLWADGAGTVHVLCGNTSASSPLAAPTGSFGADPETRARFTVSQVPGEGAVLDASSSTPAGGITSYTWWLADGTAAEGQEWVLPATPGRHQVNLAVTAEGSTCDYASEPVVVLCPSGDVAPWATADIGEPEYPGAARLVGPDGSGEPGGLALCAGPYRAGADGWFFVHQEMGGNFRLAAGVAEFAGEERGSLVALLARASLDPDAAFAAAVLALRSDGTFGLRFRYRALQGGRVRTLSPGVVVEDPRVSLRLERHGRTFVGEYSLDGESWAELGRQDLEAPQVFQVGVGAGEQWSVSLPVLSDFEALGVRLSGLELESLPFVFLRGDCDGQPSPGTGNQLTLSDAVRSFRHCFGGAEVPCRAACDTTGDGDPCTGVTDGILILEYLFRGGGAPPAPFPECGPSDLPGDLALGCDQGCG